MAYRHLASLGALITTLGLAVDRFPQQHITFPFQSISSGTALAPRISSYSVIGARKFSSWGFSLDINLSLKAAIYNGLYRRPSTLAPTCSTGNCTWPVFSSISVCNRYLDVSERIVNGMLPNGLRLRDTTADLGHPTLVTASGLLLTKQLRYTRAKLTNLSVTNKIQGYECALYWCIQEYNSSVIVDIFHENITATWSNKSLSTSEIGQRECFNGTYPDHSTGYFLFTPPNGASADSTIDNHQNFSVSDDSQVTIESYFRSFLIESISGEPGFGYSSSSDAMEALLNVTECSNHNFPWD